VKYVLLIGALLAAGAVATAVVFLLDGPDPVIPVTTVPQIPEGDPAPEVVPGDPVSVTGTVVDPAGAPIASVEVYLLSPEDPLVPTAAPRRVRTGEDGTFVLRGREEERLDIIAYRPGYRPGLVPEISPGTTHRVTLRPGVVVTGVVTDDLGRPLAGVTVTARSSGTNLVPRRGFFLPNHASFDLTWVRTLTSTDGSFTLRGVGEGLLEITAEKRGYPEMRAPTLRFDPASGPADLVLLRPFVASITVLDAESSMPLPRVGVSVSRVDAEDEQADGRTNHKGVFTGRMPWPAAQAPDCRVSVVAWDRRYGEFRADGIPLSKVEEGRGFTLQAVRRDPGVVRVKLVYDNGEAYRGWIGFMFEISPKLRQHRGGRPDEDGFVTMKVPSGLYQTVRVASSGTIGRSALSQVKVVSGETVEESLVLERGGDLIISFRGAEKSARLRGRIRFESNDFNVTHGVWGRAPNLSDVPPGTLTMTADIDGYRQVVKILTVKKGQKQKVPVELRRP
jgi:hypothetical protein